MALKYVRLPRHPSQMGADDLAACLADLPDAQVIRSVLLAEVEAIRAGEEHEPRTMRNLWYNLVKPALSRAGILNKTTRTGKPVEWADNVSKSLAELVRAGATTYEELLIVDGSRNRQVAQRVTEPVASVDLVGAHFPWVILFTEKDTIWGEVEALASLYGVSVVSGKGQPSNACTEHTIRSILRSPAYEENRPGRLVLLSLTDYDPAGYTIAQSQYNQIVEAVDGFHKAGELPLVENIRIGLEPEQLTPAELEANAYEPKDQGLEDWYAQTGGVNGKRLGLELDALDLSALRRMFAEEIERHVDLDLRRDDLKRAYMDLIACKLLLPDFDARRQQLQEAVWSSELGQYIYEAPIPGDLFKRAAVAGLDAINPVGLGLFGCADRVLAAMRRELVRQNGAHGRDR